MVGQRLLVENCSLKEKVKYIGWQFFSLGVTNFELVSTCFGRHGELQDDVPTVRVAVGPFSLGLSVETPCI